MWLDKRVDFVMTIRFAGAGTSVLTAVVSLRGVNAPTCPMCGRTHDLEWTLGVRGVVRRGVLAICVPRRARGRHTTPNRDLTATKRGELHQ